MEKLKNIKHILKKLLQDKSKIVQLESYSIDTLVDICLENKLYESIKLLFQPITASRKTKIYFDVFSTNVISKIVNVKELEDEIHSNNSFQTEELDNLFESDDVIYEKGKSITIPKKVKQDILSSFYNLNWSLISQIKIKDSHARQISGIGHPIKNFNDIIYYAELACLPACAQLFSKNIETTMNDTDCVIEDNCNSGICKIHINYNTLDTSNKKISQELIQERKAKIVMDGNIESLVLFVPCKSNDTIGEIASKLQALTIKFKKQDILYGKHSVQEEYNILLNWLDRFSIDHNDYFKNGVTIEKMLSIIDSFKLNTVYDKEEGIFWDYPEYLDKHKKYLDQNKQKTNKL